MRASVRTGALLCALVIVLAGCASPAPRPAPTPRPVTATESELLAVARFNNFDAGSRPFTADVTEKGSALHLQGWVDYAAHVGYAAVTGTFAAQALLWTPSSVAIRPQDADADGNPVLPIAPSNDSWVSHPLDATASRLDSLLGTLIALGTDRPDNPLLIQQTGAFWLRTERVKGVKTTVFAAPPSDVPPDASAPPITADTSSLRLWVSEKGLIMRAQIRLGGDEWTTIDMPDTPAPAVKVPTS